MTSLPSPPGALDAAIARRLRDAFTAEEFNFASFRTLGLIGTPGWRAGIRQKSQTMPTFACGVLVRFFAVRDPIPADVLAAALGGGGGADILAALERAGIAVKQPDGTFVCPFQLTPSATLLVLSDPIDDPASQNPPDEYIIPVSGSARNVDDLTVREPCELAVDLACGQGFHALRSMSHARRAIATDLAPRALAFTRANAALNGFADRIETREGSFFDPLADVVGKVDLLTCNPPFVMQPGAHITSAVSPTEGDGMVESLVRGLPRMLKEGGWATMSGLWENADPRDWHSRIRGWLVDSGCDALILQYQTYLPNEYLQAWFPPDQRAPIEAGWKTLCDRRKIGAVTYGGLIIRKRSGPNWVATMSTPIFARSGSASDQIKAYFASQTAMQTMWGPMDLYDKKLRIAAGWRFDPTQGQPRSAPAGVPRGLAIPVPGAARWEPLLLAFDGASTTRETLTRLGVDGKPTLPIDHPEAAATIQNLIGAGCLDIVG